MPAVIPQETIIAGDTWSRAFEIRRRSTVDPLQSDPVPLTAEGWGDWAAQWRPNPSSQVEPIVLSVDTSQANDGILVVSATAAQTREMGGDGVWDVQGERGAEVKTWLSGSFDWQWDVTRT